jgi:hypothetical protein
MLNPSQILDLLIGTPEWDTFWTGKISSSRISAIMNENGIAEGGKNYLLHKAMEKICNNKKTVSESDFDDEDDPDWGKKYEPDAIKIYCSIMGCEPIKTQKTIHKAGTNFGSIPDGLFLQPIDSEFIAIPVEVKCPVGYPKFYRAYLSESPLCIKEYDTKHYWQVLDQMQSCDAFIGHLLYYHPHFPAQGNYNLITFKREELIEDFLLLDKRKKESDILIQEYIDAYHSISQSRTKQ